MHVEADLLNGIGKIWSSEGQILKSTSKAPEVCSILNRNTICIELWVAINQGGTGLALGHTSSGEYVKHILSL